MIFMNISHIISILTITILISILLNHATMQTTELDEIFQNRMDEAMVEIDIDTSIPVDVYAKHQDCSNCDFTKMSDPKTGSRIYIDIFSDYIFKVDNGIICNLNRTANKISEYSVYDLVIDKASYECHLNLKSIYSSSAYTHATFLVVILVLILISSMVHDRHDFNARLNCLDTFRGLSVFLMIFVNYGAGGYKHLQHKPWHNVNLADFVFPWFLWIMGVSIGISTQKTVEFKKIFFKSLKLFLCGIMLNTRFGVQLADIRIMGVLQRIALCYLAVCLIRFKFPERNSPTNRWAIVIALMGTWLIVVLYMPVPGCPYGYFGAGGIDEFSRYMNCTGGATGTIDRLVFGFRHIYQRPTCKAVYKTVQPFDPEGIMGTFNCIVLVFLGTQTGNIFVKYASPWKRIKLCMMWSAISFLVFNCLCMNGMFNSENCLIPVNKNLWTLSYTWIMSACSNTILAVLYYLVDVEQLWLGKPFKYLGMNSVLIYILHVLFGSTFPIQFIVPNTHAHQLMMDLWGSVFWTLFAIYLYYKKFFFSF